MRPVECVLDVAANLRRGSRKRKQRLVFLGPTYLGYSDRRRPLGCLGRTCWDERGQRSRHWNEKRTSHAATVATVPTFPGILTLLSPAGNR